jgi:hypothetical protein
MVTRLANSELERMSNEAGRSLTLKYEYIVTCSTVAMQHREKENALLGNGWVNTFRRKRDAHNNTVTMEKGEFSVGSARSYIARTSDRMSAVQLRVNL